MANHDVSANFQESLHPSDHDRKSLNEMLQELRVLQQGSQILTGFLVLLPFTDGFIKIGSSERIFYITAFIASLICLICFSAPAAQHRLKRPLHHRVKFKQMSTRIINLGTFALSIALIATTQLVLNEVVGDRWSYFGTLLIALLIGTMWWLIPLTQQRRNHS
ncbi:MAG: DUF6328 family protein [Snowella sp.]|nr:DUF6328 family protein [Snowella sp.]